MLTPSDNYDKTRQTDGLIPASQLQLNFVNDKLLPVLLTIFYDFES